MKSLLCVITLAICCLFGVTGCSDDSSSSNDKITTQPNILFIVLDDIGVDQLKAFGYGGKNQAATPSIDAIAHQGVRFRNTWSMPTCSPSRATFFDGQYPFRTGVRFAIVWNTLANSQLSPYTLTTPELFKQKGYANALIGKMHLGGMALSPDRNPMGAEAMRDLGWDYFAGYDIGAPRPIDTTAGGILPEGTYQCGWVPNTRSDPVNGADSGICYLPDGSHINMFDANQYPRPGHTCVTKGGLFDPGSQHYSEKRRKELKFNNDNGYYTARLIINHEDGSTDVLPNTSPKTRGYRTTTETDLAIQWIRKTQKKDPNKPWMLSLGYSASHTPWQPPPAKLLPQSDDTLHLKGCGTPPTNGNQPPSISDFTDQRVIFQHMLEAMDHEIGRLLVATGVATENADGQLVYQPDSNTVVVIVGDNGTYAPGVKLPFDYMRAKATPYQTGVWVPLIVAGPMVQQPDRAVGAMVNTVDLYSLFAELAGYSQSELTSAAAPRALDTKPVLPYLTQPGHASIRSTNFNGDGKNFSSEVPPPCVVPLLDACIQVFSLKPVCLDQGGVWYGPGNDVPGVPSAGLNSCSAVNDFLTHQGEQPVDIYPDARQALRDAHYKLVRTMHKGSPECHNASCQTVDYEFYEINESKNPNQLKLDRKEHNLLKGTRTPADLTPEQKKHYDALKTKLTQLLASKVNCPGDGNRDLRVDQKDLDNWKHWANTNGGHSSWYDFNHDGLTNQADRSIIEANMGKVCR